MDRSLRQPQASGTWAQLCLMMVPSLRDTLLDSTDDSSIDKLETSFKQQEHFCQFQDMTDMLLCRIHLPVRSWIIDPSSRLTKKNTNHGNEMYCKILCIFYIDHVPTRKSVPRSSRQVDHMRTRRPLYWEMQTAVVWTCLPLIRSGQNHLAEHSERGKKRRQTEEEVGRQHQGIDRPGVCQVPEGSGEQGEMKELGCEIICGAATTLAIKGLMMMIMMIIMMMFTSISLSFSVLSKEVSS